MNRIPPKCTCSILLSILMLSGCSQNPDSLASGRLSGDWGITAADRLLRKLGEKPELESGEPDPNRSKLAAPKMVLQFGSNGSLKTITRLGRFDPPPKEGSWKMLAWDQAAQMMQIECSIGGQITEHEVQFLEADLIELVPPNMAGTSSKLQFQRLK